MNLIMTENVILSIAFMMCAVALAYIAMRWDSR